MAEFAELKPDELDPDEVNLGELNSGELGSDADELDVDELSSSAERGVAGRRLELVVARAVVPEVASAGALAPSGTSP
jgi:hypothetical protein